MSEPEKQDVLTVINKCSLFSNSFFSGILCGYCGAAVHHLSQGSSVLQIPLLSKATCRYGKLLEKQKGKSAFCAELFFFLK